MPKEDILSVEQSEELIIEMLILSINGVRVTHGNQWPNVWKDAEEGKSYNTAPFYLIRG